MILFYCLNMGLLLGARVIIIASLIIPSVMISTIIRFMRTLVTFMSRFPTGKSSDLGRISLISIPICRIILEILCTGKSPGCIKVGPGCVEIGSRRIKVWPRLVKVGPG